MTTLTPSEINHAIIDGNWTNDQLNSFMMAIKFSRNQITRQNRVSFRVGEQVKFNSSRTGRVEVGTLQKINRKFVIVRTATVQWRVPMNMLEAA